MNFAIWVTTKCNLKCNYCYEGNEKKCLTLNENNANRILKYIIHNINMIQDSSIDITYHGGEPFLNFEMIRYITIQLENEFPDKKFYFSVTTNATILNKEILKFISVHRFEISISIDGGEKTHNLNRVYANGKGSYNEVIKNSSEILNVLPQTRARMTFNENTVYELAKNIHCLIKEGFKIIVPIQDFCMKKWNKEYLSILKEQIKIAKEYVELYGVSIGICEPLDVGRKKICNGGRTSINIYSDGSIYPCMVGAGLPEFNIGDVDKGIDTKKLDFILGYSKQEVKECVSCTYYNYCDNCRCRIINKVLRGKYDFPSEIVCLYNHAILEMNGIEY